MNNTTVPYNVLRDNDMSNI
ncbi:Protein of unknown function [Bacillus mycoides]|nr:Protein of unknown function [Bacillus mycoides]